MPINNFIIDTNDLLLITGANGFIGTRLVAALIRLGFRNLRCFVRPSGNMVRLNQIIEGAPNGSVSVVKGNLLSRDECRSAAEGVKVIIHLAAGIEKTFPGSYLNSVVTTRNLIEAALADGQLKRFLNVSTFAVYANWDMKKGALLDESCKFEDHLLERYEPYVYAKAKQDELVLEYGKKAQLPYVIVRPGAVYGPGKRQITARVGIDTFGFFMHLGGSNQIPLTYVENCADAIAYAAISSGIDGEVFNIVDDDLPTSRKWLKMYKQGAGYFRSIYLPYCVFYFLSYLWEKYSGWSRNQLPPAFNRRRCATYWKGNTYSNDKLKKLTGWKPRVSFDEAARRYFE